MICSTSTPAGGLETWGGGAEGFAGEAMAATALLDSMRSRAVPSLARWMSSSICLKYSFPKSALCAVLPSSADSSVSEACLPGRDTEPALTSAEVLKSLSWAWELSADRRAPPCWPWPSSEDTTPTSSTATTILTAPSWLPVFAPVLPISATGA